MRKFLFLMLAASVLLSAGPTFAAPCGTGLDTGDVTFRGSDSDDCTGPVDGNIDHNSVPITLFGIEFTAGLTDEGSGGSVTIDGVTFGLTADVNEKSGSWTLTFTADPDQTVVHDLAVIVKAGPQYAAYLFNDESFTTDGSGNGTFEVTFTNPNSGQINGLSHLTVLFAAGESTTVPEPTTLVLLGVGLVGAMAVRRRKTRQSA